MYEYGFVENADYILLSNFEKQIGSGGHNEMDHPIKLDRAKEISMIQRTEKLELLLFHLYICSLPHLAFQHLMSMIFRA